MLRNPSDRVTKATVLGAYEPSPLYLCTINTAMVEPVIARTIIKSEAFRRRRSTAVLAA